MITNSQLEYLQDLYVEANMEAPDTLEDLTKEEASDLIKEMKEIVG